MKNQDLRLPICSIVRIIVIKLCLFSTLFKMNAIMGNNKRAPKVSKIKNKLVRSTFGFGTIT